MSYIIKGTINWHTITNAARKSQIILSNPKSAEKDVYGNFKLFVHENPDKTNTDASLCLQKEKENTSKYTSVGIFITPDLEDKIKFSNEVKRARMNGYVVENKFKPSTVTISLNMTNIRKDIEAKPTMLTDAGDFDVEIEIRDKCNEYGNDVAVRYKDTNEYIGSGKTQMAWAEWENNKNNPITSPTTNNQSNPDNAENDIPIPEVEDDLPF